MRKEILGKVIYSNENSANIKIQNDKKYLKYINYRGNKEKIITVNNYIGLQSGQYVNLNVNKLLSFKMIYIYIIQPIIFALIGFLFGLYISLILKQESLIYEITFACIACTIAFIYKDYYKEKNKDSMFKKYEIKKIL